MIDEYFGLDTIEEYLAEFGPPKGFKLIGEDGNGFFIIGRLGNALKDAKAPKEFREYVAREMMSGDYNHLLQVAMRFVEDDYDDEC